MTNEQWISVNDRLPENEWAHVLVCCTDGFVFTAMYVYGEKNRKYFESESRVYELDDVAYWMPVPELPQELVVKLKCNKLNAILHILADMMKTIPDQTKQGVERILKESHQYD